MMDVEEKVETVGGVDMARFILSAFADEAADALDEQIAALETAGIGNIELRGVNGKSCADLTDGEARRTRTALEAAGIGISALGSPYGKYPVDQPFGPHLAAFRRGLELCAILGCERVRMFSFFIPEGDDPAQWRGEVFDRLEAMLDAAEAAGVQLVHENEKGIYGDTDGRCLELMERFGGRLGFAFDPANFIQCGVDPLAAFERLHRFITYMHVKDALKADGAVVRAGRGDGSVPEILSRLHREREGDFILTVEPHLALFGGLKTLQQDVLKRDESFPDQRTAFSAACDALKAILGEVSA